MEPDSKATEPKTESVWDYPRPPRLEQTAKKIQVVFNQQTIADTQRALRVLETSHPPTYYIPPGDIRTEYLQPSEKTSYCEFKGVAHYYHVTVGGQMRRNAAWYYPDPTPGYRLLRDHVAFYPGLMDACYVDGVRVEPQPGGFYGGWITPEIIGPFKGGPGSQGW